jgi:hypothetical protein
MQSGTLVAKAGPQPPDGELMVVGFGRNVYGRFSLLGAYNPQTGTLRCERKYMLSKLGMSLFLYLIIFRRRVTIFCQREGLTVCEILVWPVMQTTLLVWLPLLLPVQMVRAVKCRLAINIQDLVMLVPPMMLLVMYWDTMMAGYWTNGCQQNEGGTL